MNGVRLAVHQSSRRSDSLKLFSRTKSPSLAVVSEIASHMNDRVELATMKPPGELTWRNDIGQLPFGEIAPFVAGAHGIGDDNVAGVRLIETGHDIGSDESGSAGY